MNESRYNIPVPLLALLAVLAEPSIARAQFDRYAPSIPAERRYAANQGIALEVGGGVSDFTGKQLRNITDPGAFWTARLIVGTRKPLAFEGAYTGSMRNVTAMGLDTRALLSSHGAEGALRLNLTTSAVQPYLLGGVGWRQYKIVREQTNASTLRENDDVLELPVGAGVAFRFSHLVLDARFDYRFTFDQDLVRNVDLGKATEGLANWNAGARLGYEF